MANEDVRDLDRDARIKKWFDDCVTKHPVLFKWVNHRGSRGPGYSPGCREPISWGVECGDGWLPILEKLFDQLGEIGFVQLLQVKEKFGTLRVYCRYDYSGWVLSDDDMKRAKEAHRSQVDALILEAEEACAKTCELCGSQTDVELRGTRWIMTTCKKCHNTGA